MTAMFASDLRALDVFTLECDTMFEKSGSNEVSLPIAAHRSPSSSSTAASPHQTQPHQRSGHGGNCNDDGLDGIMVNDMKMVMSSTYRHNKSGWPSTNPSREKRI